MRFPAVLLLSIPAISGAADYAGPAACASCHGDIARVQANTNMAKTWIPVNDPNVPGQPLPIEAEVGGTRHGISYLARVSQVDGLPLARSALIETRMMKSAHGGELVLSPGFPEQTPTRLDTSMGRALAPDFEQKCLNCHGQPAAGTGAGGVHCESCHGPGGDHAKAKGAIHMASVDQMKTCETCHGGFARLSDPLPEDLMISNQVNALRNSECFRNSSGLTCTTCHDPHRDGTAVSARSNAACRNCHTLEKAQHAAVCPVNNKEGCTSCHMREEKRGAFRLVDHWIRADHPGIAHDPKLRSTLRPLRLYLRLIVTTEESKATEALARLRAGETFFAVAQRYSVDPSAPGGGFVGDMQLDTMAAPLANTAAALAPGAYSEVVANGNKYFIVQRLPADFRAEANRIAAEATRLRMEHKLEQASARFQEALSIYPFFLRGLIFLAGTLGEQGQGPRAAAILQFASQLYPLDPAAPYNLGVTLGAMGRLSEEAAAYRKAISLEPSLIGAYQNLGASLFSRNQLQEAETVFREGLRQDPLAVALYYNLSLVQDAEGKSAEAKSSLAVARKLNAAFVVAQAGTSK